MDYAQRLPSERAFAAQLHALQQHDTQPKPQGWKLSPQAVKTFILGSDGQAIEGQVIQRKIFGNDALIERAIVTLIGQRGLMLVGEPGTAKSLLSELLAAAISGNSTLTVQGSAGLIEENIRYSWNYAALLKSGPTQSALVPGPLHQAMQQGAIMRFEEISRCPIEIQDALIPVLSDRILHIPELGEHASLLSRQGFNIIATANLKDRGVNEMSSALKRRFNFETMRPLQSLSEQTELVMREVNRQLAVQQIPLRLDQDIADLLTTAFYELRQGEVQGTAIDSPSTLLSSAEAISVGYSAATQCYYFGQTQIRPRDLSRYLIGTVIKDNDEDIKRYQEYLRLVQRKRHDQPLWVDFSQATF